MKFDTFDFLGMWGIHDGSIKISNWFEKWWMIYCGLSFDFLIINPEGSLCAIARLF